MGALLQEAKDKSPVILEEAIGCFRTALALRPAAGVVHNNLGALLLENNQLDEAIAEVRKAIDINPKNAHAHINLGLALYHKDRLDDAMVECRKAIDLDPKNARAHFNLGLAYSAKNQWDEAIAEFGNGIELDPKDAPAHDKLGTALANNNRSEEGMAEFCKAIDIDPKYALAHYNLALAFQVKNRLDEAVAEYDGKLSLGLSPAHPALNIEQAVDRLTTADQGDPLQVAASQIVLLSNFYGLALEQARRSFRWALAASIVGLLFFLGAVAFVLQEKGSNAATVSVISGAIVEVLAGVNFYLYARTTGQLSVFHARLDVTQRFLLANSLCESLEGEIKQKTRSDLIARLTTVAGGASQQGTQ